MATWLPHGTVYARTQARVWPCGWDRGDAMGCPAAVPRHFAFSASHHYSSLSALVGVLCVRVCVRVCFGAGLSHAGAGLGGRRAAAGARPAPTHWPVPGNSRLGPGVGLQCCPLPLAQCACACALLLSHPVGWGRVGAEAAATSVVSGIPLCGLLSITATATATMKYFCSLRLLLPPLPVALTPGLAECRLAFGSTTVAALVGLPSSQAPRVLGQQHHTAPF